MTWLAWLLTLMTCAVIATACCAPARAEDIPTQPPRSEGLTLQLGGGAFAAPAYAGSKTTRVSVVPALSGSYGKSVEFGFPEGLRVTVLRIGGLTAGPVAQLGLGRRESDDRRALHGLGNIGTAVDLGGFARYEVGDLFLKAVLVKDVADGDKGVVGTVSTGTAVPVAFISGRPILLGTEISTRIADSQSMQSQFGVTQAQSARSGRAAFRPAGGIEQAGVSASLITPINGRFTLTAIAAFDRLLRDAARSPIVAHHVGSASQAMGGLVLSCQLY